MTKRISVGEAENEVSDITQRLENQRTALVELRRMVRSSERTLDFSKKNTDTALAKAEEAKEKLNQTKSLLKDRKDEYLVQSRRMARKLMELENNLRNTETLLNSQEAKAEELNRNWVEAKKNRDEDARMYLEYNEKITENMKVLKCTEQDLCKAVKRADDAKEEQQAAKRRKLKRHSVVATMEEKDMPLNPFSNYQTSEVSNEFENSGLKRRIQLMCKLIEHPDTPENERSQAMKNVKRLLDKHNLDQAEVDNYQEAVPDKDVSVVPVRISSQNCTKTNLLSWYHELASAVAMNFGVKYFYKKSRDWRKYAEFSFYGLKINSQLAAFVFVQSFHQLREMMTTYRPKQEDQNKPLRTLRTSYAHGVCDRLFDVALQRNRERRKKSRLQKERAHRLELAKRRGDERVVENGENSGENSGERDDIDEDENDPEKQQANKRAVAVIQKKAGDRALEKHNITLGKAVKIAKPVLVDAAFQDGVEQAKRIDFERRQIDNAESS